MIIRYFTYLRKQINSEVSTSYGKRAAFRHLLCHDLCFCSSGCRQCEFLRQSRGHLFPSSRKNPSNRPSQKYGVENIIGECERRHREIPLWRDHIRWMESKRPLALLCRGLLFRWNIEALFYCSGYFPFAALASSSLSMAMSWPQQESLPFPPWSTSTIFPHIVHL